MLAMNAPEPRSVFPDVRIPEGLEGEDLETVRRVVRLARLLDAQFRIPGTGVRMGLDGLIGLVPGIGDAAAMLLAGYIFAEAARARVSPGTLAAMAANTLFDTILGSVPVLGDIFDIAYKSNLRNARLIIRDIEKRTVNEQARETT